MPPQKLLLCSNAAKILIIQSFSSSEACHFSPHHHSRTSVWAGLYVHNECVHSVSMAQGKARNGLSMKFRKVHVSMCMHGVSNLGLHAKACPITKFIEILYCQSMCIFFRNQLKFRLAVLIMQHGSQGLNGAKYLLEISSIMFLS